MNSKSSLPHKWAHSADPTEKFAGKKVSMQYIWTLQSQAYRSSNLAFASRLAFLRSAGSRKASLLMIFLSRLTSTE